MKEDTEHYLQFFTFLSVIAIIFISIIILDFPFRLYFGVIYIGFALIIVSTIMVWIDSKKITFIIIMYSAGICIILSNLYFLWQYTRWLEGLNLNGYAIVIISLIGFISALFSLIKVKFLFGRGPISKPKIEITEKMKKDMDTYLRYFLILSVIFIIFFMISVIIINYSQPLAWYLFNRFSYGMIGLVIIIVSISVMYNKYKMVNLIFKIYITGICFIIFNLCYLWLYSYWHFSIRWIGYILAIISLIGFIGAVYLLKKVKFLFGSGVLSSKKRYQMVIPHVGVSDESTPPPTVMERTNMSEVILNKCGKFGYVGALFLVIAPFLPAGYRAYMIASTSGEGMGLYFRWFFGFYFSIYWISEKGQLNEGATNTGIYIPELYIYLLGVMIGMVLLIMGIVTLIKSTQLKRQEIDYKIGGIILLICGVVSIVSLGVWIYFTRLYYDIGPAVIFGIIGSMLLIICGSLIIKHSR